MWQCSVFCSVAAAKVGAGARSENRKNAKQPENSSVAAAGINVTNIGTFAKVCATQRAGTTKMPSGEGAALQGVRHRCILRHAAPVCHRGGCIMPCAARASVQVVPAKSAKRANQMTQIIKTRVLVGRRGGGGSGKLLVTSIRAGRTRTQHYVADTLH